MRVISRIVGVFGSIGALFHQLIDRVRLPMPNRMRNFLQRRRRVVKLQEYYYLKYAISVLRIIAWVVLTIGLIGSFFWGITAGGFGGALRIVLGVIGSFLAWIVLLAARELIYLCIHLEEDTRSTTEGIIDESN
ncbi:MAG: hypothetical protein JSW22_06950 [Chloroflexota bacterium]|nr:MAG: hypothetical protein JSW22_06950 [Chloroflexota bacterium]